MPHKSKLEVLNDPFESHFKYFIIDNQNTGFDPLDKMLEALRSYYYQNEGSFVLEDLPKKWEEKHPGEKFFPATQIQ